MGKRFIRKVKKFIEKVLMIKKRRKENREGVLGLCLNSTKILVEEEKTLG